MNVFDHIEALELEDSEENCRQETYTYPSCTTKKCPGKIRTILQMPTAERPALCGECLKRFVSPGVKV